MTQINLPKQDQTGANEWADVQDNDVAIANVVNGNLDNNNIAAGANIAHNKLASIPTGSVLLGNGGTPTATALSGDATVSASGALTISNDAVTTSKILNDAVTAAKLADDASTDANRAVTSDHIRDNAITKAKVADDAIASAELDFATASTGTSTDTDFTSSFGSNFGGTISLDPGTYFVSGGASISYKASTVSVLLTLNVASGTASLAPSAGLGAYGWVTELHQQDHLQVASIVTVTAAATLSLRYAASGTWTRLESHLSAFGIKD